MGTVLGNVEEFEWDENNQLKNWEKHGVRISESEEIFFDSKAMLFYDEAHSGDEERHYILGKTQAGRHLFVAFTIRGKKIRVISARDMSVIERRDYDEGIEENPEV